MQIILEDGRKFDAKFAHAPTLSGDCVLEIRNGERLSFAELAVAFSGQDLIAKRDENEGDADFAGFTDLYFMRVNLDGSVTMFLRKGETS